MPLSNNETFISVDIETAGPNPAGYAMLSIGACTISKPVSKFYIELQPDKEQFLPDALRISGLNMDMLKEHGEPPKTAMQKFADWVTEVTPQDSRAIFVAFNAPFDWMFVNDYFHRYLGHNPFGHSALDIKAFYMGMTGVVWTETGFARVTEYFDIQHPLTHNALQDALDQAELLKRMLEEARKND